MIILASDTSGKSISVALAVRGRIIDEIMEKEKMQHVSNLQPAINKLLARNGLSLQDVDLFAVTTGPGSFTGIRIGLSAVMGMAYGTGKKVFAVSSLAALAAAVSTKEHIIAPVIDARGGRVYSGIYENGVSRIEEIPREISDYLKLLTEQYPGDEIIVFVGDGSSIIKEHVDALAANHLIKPFTYRFKSASSVKNSVSAAEVALLAHVAYERGEDFLPAHELRATYGIESSAKRKLDKEGEK